jgi:Asp-tRNA(Asn)/Glu-tRNA(Gln) amidotransferase A subunit family amidase
MTAKRSIGAALRSTLAVAATVSVAGACAPPADTASIDVVELDVTRLHAALSDGRTTCRAVVQAHLDRIAAYDDRLGAITVLNPRALERADSLDLAAERGEPRGALHCVPMLVKDNFDTHDMVTAGGSIALRQSVPPDDAFMVRRIREAGAVVVAKTNMAEWAFSPRETVSSAFDTTRNAYDLERTPAGSSGGTASGIAASFGVIGLGSDTGNSIRGPSSHLALVGIRSTLGLTSRDGVVPLSFDRDVAGPMGRTVEDVVRVFEVIVGVDPADPYTELGRGRTEPDYTALLDADALDGARLGVLTALAPDVETDTAVARLFDDAVADLRRAGADVVDVDFDVGAQLDRPGMFCRRFRYDMARYLETLGPAAPIRDVLEVLDSGAHHPSVERSLRSYESTAADVHPSEWDPACPDFAEHPERQAYLADLVAAMDDAGVDALVYPSWLSQPAPIDRANEEYRGDNSQRVAPATGTPAVSVPMGFAASGLPAGLQLLGRPYDDALLLRLAYAYEQATAHRRPPAGFPALGADGG